MKMFNKIIGNLFCLCLYLCIELCFGNRVDVKTSSGVVRGQTIEVLNRSIDQFLGIPYAEPPIGELRFDKPKPIGKPLEVMNKIINI